MSGTGHDARLVLADGRVLEYWDGGDPNGRAIIFQPGTPVSRVLGRWAHQAAVDAGVRLIAVNRPGYGGSTSTPTSPSLAAVGRDTRALRTHLGLDGYGVVGSSGGGPFAVATAIADAKAVRVVGVVGGVGPWRELNDPSADQEDRACLARLDAGDVAGAWTCLYRDVDEQGRSRTLAQAVDTIFTGDGSSLVEDADYRSIWTENMQVVRDNPDGWVSDNLAWGGAWDVDPRDVTTPSLLFYGTVDAHCQPETHGRWYADRISGAELVVVPSTGHMDVIDAHWAEVLAGLLRLWG